MSISVTIPCGAVTTESIKEEVIRLNDYQDALTIRALLRKNFNKEFNWEQWQSIRKVLHERIEVGFDLIFNWDRLGMRLFPRQRKSEIEKILDAADRSMLKKNYARAKKQYAAAAVRIKKDYDRGNKSSEMLYWKTLHSLGRALFSDGKFDHALKTYDLIPGDYYQFRRVLFEKMWAAFRSSQFDRALGALASQRSSYFSEYLNPEAYLVQLYIYKSLCREDEFKVAEDSVKRYLQALENNTFSFKEWAKESIANTSLLKLVTQDSIEDSELISNGAVANERKRVASILRKRFRSIRKGRIKRLKRVLGYAKLAILEQTPALKKVNQLPNPEILRETSYEYWPVSDTEEWIDEIGLHYFVGESQCKQ